MSGSAGLGNRAAVIAAIRKFGERPFSIDDLVRETQLPEAYCALVLQRLEEAGSEFAPSSRQSADSQQEALQAALELHKKNPALFSKLKAQQADAAAKAYRRTALEGLIDRMRAQEGEDGIKHQDREA